MLVQRTVLAPAVLTVLPVVQPRSQSAPPASARSPKHPQQPARPQVGRRGFVSAAGIVECPPTVASEVTEGQEIATIAVSPCGSLDNKDWKGYGPICMDQSGTSLSGATRSLNTDPYNLRAEELAVAECARGVDVRRTWSEQEMVRSFGGQIFPGTPDGVFESWEGALTCVQVVRVPVVADMSPLEMQETLNHTVLVKIVKSQQWLRACNVVPQDFVIFGWLPFMIPDEVVESGQALMQRVQQLDARFSLRLAVPTEPGALFPALFAHGAQSRKAQSDSRSRCISESDVSAYTGLDDESEEQEEACTWDITWAWESDLICLGASDAEGSGAGGSDDDDEVNIEWDITWGWQSDDCHSPKHELEHRCAEIQAHSSVAADSDGISSLSGFIWDNGG
mmetsp:Transcript_71783/g.186405  ORF Transcript_71783/g.186405 Transcript_71783/m.186405 type:complete len:394 (+) Transcript_71783:130-1311(+)